MIYEIKNCTRRTPVVHIAYLGLKAARKLITVMGIWYYYLALKIVICDSSFNKISPEQSVVSPAR